MLASVELHIKFTTLHNKKCTTALELIGLIVNIHEHNTLSYYLQQLQPQASYLSEQHKNM